LSERSAETRAEAALFRQALLAAILLPLFLMAVYSACAWITSFRAVVPTWHFAFEQRITLLPWMIIPYVSFHFAMAIAPMFCSNSDEIAIYARRFVFVVMVSGVLLLLLPLHFGIVRPVVTGSFALPLRVLWQLDTNGNLFPSLHVAVAGVVWPIYVKHAPRALAPIVHIWFTLIVVSTLFTYQHHLIDVIGGAILAIVALWLFPSRQRSAQ